MHECDWFVERLVIARWNSVTPGTRDFHAGCPVCGGSDPLHVTEKNGKALITCFSCGAGYSQVVPALEEEDSSPEPAEQEITVTRVHEDVRQTVATSSAPLPADPIEWYAEYCDVDTDWLRTLPLRATEDGWVAHTWDRAAVTKDRKPGAHDRRWSPSGSAMPRLWPTVPDVLPPEVWLCEGETDCIVLRAAGIAHAYTAGSATQPLTADEMRGLRRRGVDRVVVAYDSDKAGQKAKDETIKAAREAGLNASVASLGDPLTGAFKDWRDRWVSGEHRAPVAMSEGLDNYVPLNEVKAAMDTDLILGRLHPTAHTILFGDGGTGKGVIAAWWASQMTHGVGCPGQRPIRVLVLDYEQNAVHEWRPRVEAFGGSLTSVIIRQPDEPIWDIADYVRQAVESLEVGYVIIDSVTYACVGSEVEKSDTAVRYSLAVAELGVPVLSLAHTTKADADPKHPFGSVFWSNGARVTIGVSTKGYDEPRLLVNKKTNQAAPFKNVQIPWTWVNTGLPGELHELPASRSLNERVFEALVDGPKTVAQVIAYLDADGEGPWSTARNKDHSVSGALGELKMSMNAVLTPGKLWEVRR